jgi:hypothetical protein
VELLAAQDLRLQVVGCGPDPHYQQPQPAEQHDERADRQGQRREDPPRACPSRGAARVPMRWSHMSVSADPVATSEALPASASVGNQPSRCMRIAHRMCAAARESVLRAVRGDHIEAQPSACGLWVPADSAGAVSGGFKLFGGGPVQLAAAPRCRGHRGYLCRNNIPYTRCPRHGAIAAAGEWFVCLASARVRPGWMRLGRRVLHGGLRRSGGSADSVRGCPCDGPRGCPCARTYGGQRRCRGC